MNPETEYNTYLKRIAIAFRLDRRDVAEIMALGGETVSNSQADAWLRGRHSAGDRVSLAQRAMTRAQFDAFTRGLAEWGRRVT